MSKIIPSMVGECDRVIDSVQPVHSWNGSQMTDGRLVAACAAASADAMARPATGGRAIMDARVAQYFENVRRLTPCRASVSINGPCMLFHLPIRHILKKKSASTQI
jgi:cell division FtsZ-interacting protein ZapD